VIGCNRMGGVGICVHLNHLFSRPASKEVVAIRLRGV
jgi:hypothetical protein